LEELKGDLDPEEVKASRAMNVGRYPNRRRKAKREKEARAREEQTNQIDDQEGHQSAQVESFFVPAVTGGDYANENLSCLLVGKQVNEPKSFKRGRIETSPDSYPEDGPRPSKIPRYDTAASDLEVAPTRRTRKSRTTNTVFKQRQQVAKDVLQCPIGVDTLQPAFQEHGASLNHPCLWSALALDVDEMPTPRIAGHSNVIEPKPSPATLAFDGKLYPSLVAHVNANISKPSRVGGFGHLENSYSQTYASYPTDQYTSHSNVPAYDMAVAEASE